MDAVADDGFERVAQVGDAVLPAGQTRMTEGFPPGPYADWFERTMAPEKVAVAAAFLLSRDCGVSGEAFALGGGRELRVELVDPAVDADLVALGDHALLLVGPRTTYTVPNTTAAAGSSINGVTLFRFSVSHDTTSSDGTLSITVKSPGGIQTYLDIPVHD